MAIGYFHNCALTDRSPCDAGRLDCGGPTWVRCRGNNGSGRLGVGDELARHEWTPVFGM